MNILICCEESQAVCKAFRKYGHNAFSCDIQDCSGGHPEWHIQCDVLKVISPVKILGDSGGIHFQTNDKNYHFVQKWDLIIAHPPCTYLAKSGSCNLFNHDHSIRDYERLKKGYLAKEFFMTLYNADCDKIVIENPVPISLFGLPKWSQIIQPYYFNDPYSKATCLWIKGLPLLDYDLSDVDLMNIRSWTKLHSSAKIRSKTFTGIANAMAEQWGTDYVPIQLNIFGGYNEY